MNWKSRTICGRPYSGHFISNQYWHWWNIEVEGIPLLAYPSLYLLVQCEEDSIWWGGGRGKKHFPVHAILKSDKNVIHSHAPKYCWWEGVGMYLQLLSRTTNFAFSDSIFKFTNPVQSSLMLARKINVDFRPLWCQEDLDTFAVFYLLR